MKDFRVDAVAQIEFDEGAVWYESQRDSLGFDFIAEVDRVLARIAHQEAFATAPGDHDPARELELGPLAIAALASGRV